MAPFVPPSLEDHAMPTMSDNRRRRIVARQRKLENAQKRVSKAAKRAEKKKAG